VVLLEEIQQLFEGLDLGIGFEVINDLAGPEVIGKM